MEKELALGCTYAFNRPVWNRPQGPHDAQAPHRAFIVRSSSKFDETELTLAQAALKLRMRPRLQQRPSRSRLHALRCPLHRDAASYSRPTNTKHTTCNLWWYYGSCVFVASGGAQPRREQIFHTGHVRILPAPVGFRTAQFSRVCRCFSSRSFGSFGIKIAQSCLLGLSHWARPI